ncbi:MAG: TolC family protein, partial [Vulcanimicrobiaceae bacterium]
VSSTLGFNASMSQLIFDGGRAIAGIRSAKEGDLSGYDSLQRQLQTLAFSVANAYYKALQAEQLTVLDQQIVTQYAKQEDLVRAQIKIGAAAPSDLAQAQFLTEQKRVALVQAQGAQTQAEALFATTLGLDADSTVLPADDTPVNPAASLLTSTMTSYGSALKRAELLRPDYLSADHNVEASKESLRYTKLARFPLLSGQASDGYNSTLANGSQLKESKSLGLTLSIPIFDQGLTNYNVAVAASQLDVAVAGLASSKLTVESDVRSALAGYASAVAAVSQAQAEVKSAQTAFDASNARYKIGAATLLDLLTQQTNLSQAKTDLLTTTFNLRIAEQTYEYALGETKV